MKGSPKTPVYITVFLTPKWFREFLSHHVTDETTKEKASQKGQWWLDKHTRVERLEY